MVPIIPDMQMALICDDVRQENNGKFMLIGLFDSIMAQRLPLTYPRLFIVTRWCSGEGIFEQRTRLVRPDQHTPVAEGQAIQVKLSGGAATATNIELFLNVNFHEAGLHWIEILLDGDLKIRFPLRVNLHPAGAAAPPPA